MKENNLKNLVSQALDAKKKVEAQINRLIWDYEDEIGLKVQGVQVHVAGEGKERIVISELKIEL